MKKMIRYFLFLTLSYFLLGSICLAQSTAHEEKPKVITKFLQFILRAEFANIILIDHKTSTYQLQLRGVDPSVVYFTNRPRRISDSMTTRFFLKRWIKPPPHDFISNPPNAAILYADKNLRQQMFLVLLKNPIYMPEQQQLHFFIQSMNGKSLNLPAVIKKPVITLGEITVCGVLGAWGNLPGEEQSDLECHKNGG